jgi:hypothetical protein
MSTLNNSHEELMKKTRGVKRALKHKPKMKVSGAGVKKLARLIASK